MRLVRLGARLAALVAIAATPLGTGPKVSAAPATAATAAPATSSPAASVPAIAWREWSPAAFEEARAKRRLVLLDVTARWCHWCRVMNEESYRDSAVVAAIDAGFVPIRVDFDERPDIGDRYVTDGWPTTAVLSPSGHVLLSKTYMTAPVLRDYLKEASHFYLVNRLQVDRKVAEAERAVERTWAPDSLLPPSITDEEYVERNIEGLRDLEDKEHGGFGIAPKTPRWDAISFLLRAADARRDDGLRALAVRGAAAALALQDSLDGGFFRAALQPDWTKFRYERLLNEQAAALSVLRRVARATGEERFKTAASRVEAFVRENLKPYVWTHGRVTESVGWRHSVGADARGTDGRWIDGDVYFRLGGAARARSGRLDPSPLLATDASAHYYSALLAARRPGSAAEGAGVTRLGRLMTDSLGLHHAIVGGVKSGRRLLPDLAAYGNALLDDYEYRRAPEAGTAAGLLATWLLENLEDRESGGFRYAPRDTTAIGRLRAGDKPEAANAETATFFLRLHWLTGRQEYRDAAERTSRHLQSGDKIVLDPVRAELALRLRTDPVRLLVIGADDKAKKKREWDLGTAALDAPAPEVVVRYLARPDPKPGAPSWPDGPPPNAKSPAIYRWVGGGWRGPVTDPAKVGDLLDKPTVEP